jgi:hypothetical protein
VNIKQKLTFSLFLIGLKDNSSLKIIIETLYSMMYAYMCFYISEISDNNGTKDRREELGLH